MGRADPGGLRLNDTVDTPLDSLRQAGNALLLTVDGLTDSAWHEPSVLPGWSRAHVVAHLALNGEALAAALDSLRTDRVLPMYASSESRDADIEHLAGESGYTIRERLFNATGLFAEEIEALDPDRAGMLIERVPGGPTFTADSVAGMRWREVEIHHLDLAVGRRPSDWSAEFVDAFFPVVVSHRQGEVDLTLHTPEGEVLLGAGGPVVTGSRADLAYWLSGRAVDTVGGAVPDLGPWVPSSRPPRVP